MTNTDNFYDNAKIHGNIDAGKDILNVTSVADAEKVQADYKKTSIQAHAIKRIIAERDSQDVTWGEQNHAPIEWLAILMEEVGEVATECIDQDPLLDESGYPMQLENELVQVAAVAVAMIECLHRGKWAPLRKSYQ